jgi:hypothetical protein
MTMTRKLLAGKRLKMLKSKYNQGTRPSGSKERLDSLFQCNTLRRLIKDVHWSYRESIKWEKLTAQVVSRSRK